MESEGDLAQQRDRLVALVQDLELALRPVAAAIERRQNLKSWPGVSYPDNTQIRLRLTLGDCRRILAVLAHAPKPEGE